MVIKNYTFTVRSSGFNDIININDDVIEIVNRSGIKNGNVLIFSPGSTCGITTIEYESGCIADLKEVFEQIAPMAKEYQHNLKWGDGNGFSHIRAALTKSSFNFPIIDGNPILGTWQQIILIDFDNKSRNRKIYVQIIGE